ncbi:hypothetical protein ACC692_38690, partial [Rhizobium ruizarguesonis]
MAPPLLPPGRAEEPYSLPPGRIRTRKHDLMRRKTQFVGKGGDRRLGDETNGPPAFDGTERIRHVVGRIEP